ncbi:hypothetical protein FPRO05_00232 [Fusarium proliferatum]|uniref:2EXR domain-containing protein n=1 Tax=Gibberella intermedia TaxID=948311 RepID=A0A365NM39_GIBIN|nr:hypothetical protein FPRO05_00232 [Fusarium proliferatum]
MATTFYQFSLLPRELRDQIWHFAMRPHHRGVQIFQIHNPPSHDENRPMSSSFMDYLYSVYEKFTASYWASLMARKDARPWSLGAPLCSKYHKGLDGTLDKNISTYMIDSGLWTACKESRRVIRKHFANPSNSPYGLPEPGRVSHCSGSNPFYFSIWPGSDLLILQIGNFAANKRNTQARISEFLWTPSSPPWLIGSCQEIGIEYDLAWTDASLANDTSIVSPNVILTAILLLLRLPKRRLWLVDTNLKRKAGAPSSYGRDTMQFYASGRKFVQVSLHDMVDNLNEWEYINPVAGGNYEASSIHSAWLANGAARRFPGRHHEDQIGLLGWEDLENS